MPCRASPDPAGPIRTLPRPAWHRHGGAVDLIALTDDPVCPPVSTAKLASLYGVERTRFRLIDPARHDLRRVGHLGAFSRANAALWPEILGLPA